MNRLVLVICLGLSLMAFGCVVAARSFNQPDSNRAISDEKKPIAVLRGNSVFSITLKSNPTTGYRWFLKTFDSSMITPLKQIYHPPLQIKDVKAKRSSQNVRLGVPGYEKWWFRLNKAALNVPGITKLTFCYMRPWTLGCDEEKTFTIVWYE